MLLRGLLAAPQPQNTHKRTQKMWLDSRTAPHPVQYTRTPCTSATARCVSFIHSFISFIHSFHFISFHFISFHFISFHFISFHFISFHFISFHFISFHFISFHFISFSFHFISFHFISFHFISFHFISFHFISFHFISFHFISFHFISFHSFQCRTQARTERARAVRHETQHTGCTMPSLFSSGVSSFPLFLLACAPSWCVSRLRCYARVPLSFLFCAGWTCCSGCLRGCPVVLFFCLWCTLLWI